MGYSSVGIMSLLFAILLPVLYLLMYLVRLADAWMRRDQPPRVRVIAFIVVFAVFGFVVGIFAQPLWDHGVACNAAGKPVLACFFSPVQ